MQYLQLSACCAELEYPTSGAKAPLTEPVDTAVDSIEEFHQLNADVLYEYDNRLTELVNPATLCLVGASSLSQCETLRASGCSLLASPRTTGMD